MSYQRQQATATGGKAKSSRFNGGASSSSNVNMNTSPGMNFASQPTSRASTNRILDDLLALAPPGRIEHYQPTNLSSATESQPPNITIIDYRQPGSSASLLFGTGGPGGGSANKLEHKSTFDQFASQFKTPGPLSMAAQMPLATASGNVRILDIRRTKTNRKRPKTDNNNDYENAAPIQLAHEDDDYENHNDDMAAYLQQERPPVAVGHQFNIDDDDHHRKQEQSAIRNKNQSTQPKQNQQQQQQQRQQSGETLSSFESDYDLLVYLGETETEDLVETERSLDYLDQTWRQSICGGASLAPTIDESLSELLSPANNNQQTRFGQVTTPTRTPLDYNDDFDLLWTTTSGGLGAGSSGGGPSSASPQVDSSYLNSLHRQQRANTRNKSNNYNDPNQLQIGNNQRDLLADSSYGAGQLSSWSSASLPRQAYNRRLQTGGQASATASPSKALRGRELELLSQQAKEAQAKRNHSQSIEQAHEQHSLAGNIGNKLVSLFGRNAKQHQQASGAEDKQEPTLAQPGGLTEEEAEKVRQLNEFLGQPHDTRMAPQKPRRQQQRHLADNQSGQRAPTGYDSNAAELDRLLAEMSQSLDLDSLARYDPFGADSQQRRRQAQHNQAQQVPQQSATTTTSNNNNKNQAQTSQSRPTDQQVRQQHHPNELPMKRNESLLNEYDGASRMLEQMISDQLEEALASGSGDTRLLANQADGGVQRPAGFGETAPPVRSADMAKSGRRVDQAASNSQSSPGRPRRFTPATTRQASLRDHSSQATSDEERASASSTSQVHKVSSTCSSATTETSVVQAVASRPPSSRPEPQRPPQPASHEEAFGSRNKSSQRSGARQARGAERVLHQFSFDGAPRPAPPSSGASKQRNPINYSRSLDAPAELPPPVASQKLPVDTSKQEVGQKGRIVVLNRKSTSPVASVKSAGSSSSSSSSSVDVEGVPPKPPAVDYSDYHDEDASQNVRLDTKPLASNLVLHSSSSRPHDHSNQHLNDRDNEHVIQVEACELPSAPSTSSDDDDETKPAQSGRKRVMNRMKRKTMSGVRNVRQRFNRHFSGSNEAEDKQDGAQSPKRREPTRPEPPARSSSIGSSRSGSRAEISAKDQDFAGGKHANQPGDSDSPRQSRQRARRGGAKQAEPDSRKQVEELQHEQESKKSFGQQLRDRLSRSKSRFSQFLRPLSMGRQRTDESEHRAKSTPADAGDESRQIALFQPSDIARNEQPVAPKDPDRAKRLNLDESSLERQLKADLERAETVKQSNGQQQQRKSKIGAKSPRRRSQSSDRSQASGDLSGLETSGRSNQRLFELPAIGRRSARSSKRKSRTVGASNNAGEKGRVRKRPTSLMSLKRFGESFGRPTSTRVDSGEMADLDSMKVRNGQQGSKNQQAATGLNGGRPTAAARNKRARNRSTGDQQLREARHSSPSRLETVTPVRATTDDYFGFKAPIKTTSGSEDGPTSPSRSPEVHQRVEMGPRVRPASALVVAEDDGDGKQQQEEGAVGLKLFGVRRQRVAPNRSQSLRGVERPRITTSPASDQASNLDVAHEDQQAGARQKSVSFQNLAPATNQRRPLSPVSPNTFRPVSASPAAQGSDVAATTSGGGQALMTTHQARAAGTITPIHLTPILANSTGGGTSSPPGPCLEPAPKSPNRGTGLLGDLRSKCTEYFHPGASRAQHPKVTASEAGQQRQLEQPSDTPPSRPPRRPRRRDPDSKPAARSKSLAAPSPTVIEVEPASPPASLLMVGDSPEPAHQNQAGSKKAVKRLTSFAQQLRTSAADFFTGQQHQQVQGRRNDLGSGIGRTGAEGQPQRSTVDRRPVFRNLDEPLVQNDLAQWRPIIPVSSAGSSVRRVQRSSSFRLPKDQDCLDQTNSACKSRTLNDQTASAIGVGRRVTNDDSDSTWDSGSDDDTKNVPRKCDLTNVHRDDSSSAATMNKTDERQQQQVAAAAGLGRAAAAVGSTRGDLPSGIANEATTTSTSKGGVIALGADRAASSAARSTSSSTGTDKNNAEEDQNNNNNKRKTGDTLQTNATNHNNSNIDDDHVQRRLEQKRSRLATSGDDTCKTDLKPLAGQTQLGNSVSEWKDATGAALLQAGSTTAAGHETLTTDDGAPDNSCTTFAYNQQESHQTSQPNSASLQSVNERTFKFNQNLPSPSQIFSETSKLSGASKEQAESCGPEMTATRSMMGVHRGRTRSDRDDKNGEAEPVQDSKERPADSKTSLQDNSNNNRLSIYENVNLQEQPADSESSKRTIATNLGPNSKPSIATDDKNQISSPGFRKKPELPAKPQKVEQILQSKSDQGTNLNRQQASDSKQQQKDDWSVEPDDQLVERISSQSLAKIVELQHLKQADQDKPPRQTVTSSEFKADDSCVGGAAPARRRTERRLISMTSIIHEPEDELMNLKTSVVGVQGGEQNAEETRNEQQKRSNFTMNGRRQSSMSNFSVQNDQSEDNDSDSSLVGCGRRRLEQKLTNQQRQQVKKPPVPGKPPNLPRAAGPTSGGGSLVKRLARNFDQTIQEQPAATGMLHRSVASARSAAASRAGPSNQQQHQQANNLPAKSFQMASSNKQLNEPNDEPKSDSTWYDAKSIELLDEAEVAELLREFESDGEQVAGSGQSCSDAQYLTLSHDQPGRRDERQRRQAGGNNDNENDDDDDPTLNDDETLNDDDANDELAEDLLADTSQVVSRDQDDDDDDESVYASAATNQNVSTRAEVAQQHQSGNDEASSKLSERIEVGSLGDDESGRSTGKWQQSGSAAADRARHSSVAADHDDGGNAPCQPVAAATVDDVRTREACSRGKLVVSGAHVDIDDDDRAATQFEARQQTNEITPLPQVPHLGMSTLNTTTRTNQDRSRQQTSGTEHPSKQQNNLESCGETENIPPETRLEGMGNQLESIQLIGELVAEDKSAGVSDQTGDKQIFTERLLSAFQNASVPQVVEVATETNPSKDTQPDQQRDSLDQDDDELDGSSMAGGEPNSEQSSSYREDLVSLSSESLSSESMPELRQRKNLQRLYNIVNEICTSEDKFVATLRLLNEDLRRHILASNESTTTTTTTTTAGSCTQQLFQVPPFDCVGLILKHLPQLQALNEKLLDELRQARNQWPSTQKISHVLVKIGPFLKHYSSYIRDFECIQQQFQDNMKKSSQFRDTIKRFERDHSDKCSQLSVQHHLLKPIQRIPQYRLLLQQYLHHLKPDDADYEDTVSALEVVSRVAEHANHSLSEGANFAKLLALQAKIVGGKQRDLIQPGRLFLRDGELLKVCRKQIQPRWFVLLSDSLLYMKQIQSNDILYLKYELPLDDCQVELPAETDAGEASTNTGTKLAKSTGAPQDHQSAKEQERIRQRAECEFNVCTTVRSMTLVAKSRQERDDWFEALRSAIESHVAKRRSFKSGAGCIGQQQDDAEAGQADGAQDALNELIGRKAPIWTPDSRVDTCQLCTSNFSALFRRHHCRACGRVVCSACSSNKAPLIYLKCRAARVCDQCFESLRANMHLYYLPSCQIDERELRRLDEHFRTLLKSQFVKRRIFSSKTGVK